MINHYNLPAIGNLVCFEVAARHLSFKVASRELNVTPAAVSHRIKALEEELGQNLFIREARGVSLTNAGSLLFVACQRGLATISETVSRLPTLHDPIVVTVSATSAVSALWLTPRLATFLSLYPDIPVFQMVHDNDVAAGCDLSINYGDPSSEVDEVLPLFAGRILALGTRQFAERWEINSVTDLLKAPLIHTVQEEQYWTSWNDWFEQTGHGRPVGSSYALNNYLVSLQAAENHIGAVLGWEGLLGETMINDNRLIQLVGEAMEAPDEFYLRIHNGASENALLVAKWLASSDDPLQQLDVQINGEVI